MKKHKAKQMRVRKTLIGGALAAVLAVVALAADEEKWEVLECELAKSDYFDGDSFYAETKDGEKIVVRLYGVDCPETDDRFPDWIKEQADHFGISEKEVLSWGEKAKDFLRRGFELHTMREKTYASEDGAQQREFGIIVADKDRLGEALVEAGLARAYGKPAPWPPKGWEDVWKFMKDLEEIEARAKRKKVGIWGN